MNSIDDNGAFSEQLIQKLIRSFSMNFHAYKLIYLPC